jgi:hypothetical protein
VPQIPRFSGPGKPQPSTHLSPSSHKSECPIHAGAPGPAFGTGEGLAECPIHAAASSRHGWDTTNPSPGAPGLASGTWESTTLNPHLSIHPQIRVPHLGALWAPQPLRGMGGKPRTQTGYPRPGVPTGTGAPGERSLLVGVRLGLRPWGGGPAFGTSDRNIAPEIGSTLRPRCSLRILLTIKWNVGSVLASP